MYVVTEQGEKQNKSVWKEQNLVKNYKYPDWACCLTGEYSWNVRDYRSNTEAPKQHQSVYSCTAKSVCASHCFIVIQLTINEFGEETPFLLKVKESEFSYERVKGQYS